jgi:hypothetical protein
MAPVIRIDDDVYAWLQSHARPFDDTPNSVLRRIAKLDATTATSTSSADQSAITETRPSVASTPPVERNKEAPMAERLTAAVLERRWNVKVRHGLFHRDGTWYNRLTKFPGALFDPMGYVVFQSEQDYLNCPQVSVGEQTNVRPHISAIAGYVRIVK